MSISTIYIVQINKNESQKTYVIFLSRVAQLVSSDVENVKPNLISKPLLGILQDHFSTEKNLKQC